MEQFLRRFRSFLWDDPQRPSQDRSNMDPDPENRILMEGFLFKRAGNILKTWQRRWFQVQNNQLLYLNRSKEPRVVMEDLRLCTVQPFSTIWRRFCFKVVSPTKSYMVAADSEGTRLAWTRAIKNVDLVSHPRADDSEEWSHQEEPSVSGASDLRESVHGIEPPCNDDLRRETTDTQVLTSGSAAQGVLDRKTYIVHRAISPSKGAQDPDPLSLGTSLDARASSPSKECIWTKYTLEKELGEGGCGSVYESVCKADGRQVAIKIIPQDLTMDYITIPGEAEPLPAEVALTLMVSRSPRCENIIELLEWYDNSAHLMLVLEKPSPCMDLATFIRAGPLDEKVAQIIMAQVVLAVGHCIERGVLHRDIKTENILVNTDNFKIKIIDFGCGDLLQDTPYSEFAGSWFLMPPEMIRNHQYYGRPATIWSLGILLYEVLCGDLPFTTGKQILEEDPHFKRDLSAACCDLIRSCLAKEPDNRPSIGEILDHEWFGFH